MIELALALVLAASEPTFEERWIDRIGHQPAAEVDPPAASQAFPRIRVTEKRREKHRHRTHGQCRFGKPVYHGRSWRCRR